MGHPTLRRYVLFQLPGWSLAALLLLGLASAGGLTVLTAVGLFLLWVAKDFVLYPLVWNAYLPGGETAAERVIGKRAVARDALNPWGYVEIESELWRAELAPGEAPVPPGGAVTILAVEGLTLFVTHETCKTTRSVAPILGASRMGIGPHVSAWQGEEDLGADDGGSPLRDDWPP
jgi:membrane protein implicated in regulation of membrane protease activity